LVDEFSPDLEILTTKYSEPSNNNLLDKPIESFTAILPDIQGINMLSKIFNSTNIPEISNVPNFDTIANFLISNCVDCFSSNDII